jgi:hypothetical protein
MLVHPCVWRSARAHARWAVAIVPGQVKEVVLEVRLGDCVPGLIDCDRMEGWMGGCLSTAALMGWDGVVERERSLMHPLLQYGRLLRYGNAAPGNDEATKTTAY